MSSPGSRRMLRWALAAATIVLVVLGGAAAFVLLHSPGNVSHPNLSFTAPPTTSPLPHPPAPVDRFSWPRYGFDAARTRVFAAGGAPQPPLRRGWHFDDHALLEFPPVIYGTTLYLVDDNGSAKAIDKRSGRLLWERKVGTLAAASPALGIPQQLVFVPLLSVNPNAGQSQNPGNGRLVALSMRSGRIVWTHIVPPGTESSPLAWGRSVYLGDQSGTVMSLDAATGRIQWTYRATSAVKGGPALADGILYFGDYAGRAYALNAASGREVWAVSTEGARFGFGSGNFYSTPGVAFGRVYMGNTDGRVYSFAARTGQLAWATATGAYVYASPAVADIRGLGPTVFLGSYDGNFYAFNAQSGGIRWTHGASGKISGSATVVGDVVYYSNLGTRATTGLDVRTGRQVFGFPDGAFNPVVCDPRTIYLTGYATLYQMLPVHAPGVSSRPARPPRASASGQAALRAAPSR